MDAIKLMEDAYDAGFQNRIKYFMQKAAAAILAEAGTVPGHDLRVAYASKALDGTAPPFEMATAVLTNATVAASGGQAAPDSDIEFSVNSFWNAFSGVTAAGV